MADGVTKYAGEHAKQNHVISSSQYEQIRALEDAGKAEEAQGIYLDSLNEHLRQHDKEIGVVAGTWLEAKKQASGYVQAVLDLGKGSSVDRQVEIAQSRLERLQNAKATSGDTSLDPLIADQQKTLESLNSSLHLAQQVAAAQAAYNQRQDKGRAAGDFLAELDKDTKGATRLSKALDELHVKQEQFRAAGNVLTPERQKSEEDEVRKRNTPHVARAHEDAGEGLLTSIAAQREQIRLEQQQVDHGGKLDETQKFLAVSGEKLALSISKISAARQRQIADDLGATLAESERLKASRLVQAVEDDKEKQAHDASKATLDAADSINAYSDAQRSSIAVLRQQSDLIGRSALDKEKIAANEALNQAAKQEDQRLQLLAQKAIEDDNTAGLAGVLAQRAALRGQTEQIRGELIPAIEERFAKEREGYTGVQAAMDQYRDEAANAAQFAQQVVGGGLDRLTTDLTTFAETGRSSFGDLFSFMAHEFIRELIKMQIASLLISAAGGGSGGSGSIISTIANAFGSYLSGSTSNSAATRATYTDPTYVSIPGQALGGDFKAGQSFLVGEHGPERVYTGGQSGRIVSNSDLRQAANKRSEAANDNGPRMVVNIVNNSSGKVTQQQTRQSNGVEELRVLIEDVTTSSVASGGRLHDTISKRYGLNAGGSMVRR